MSDLAGRPIVLVEDNKDDEEMTLRALRNFGFHNPIRVLRDGEEALEFLSGQTDESVPVLILLDMRLPKVTGFELLERIRGNPNTRDCKVIVLMGSDTDRSVMANRGVQTTAFVTKPLDADQLFRELRQLGPRWLLL
jgi:two-component system response regulator